MPFLNRRRVLAALIPLGAALGWRTSPAQVGSGGSGITDAVGAATLVVGSVTLTRAGQQPVPVAKDTPVRQGDVLETGAGSELHLAFEDGGYLALRPESTLRLDQYVVAGDATDAASISLLRGALRSVTGWIGKFDPARYQVSAGAATIEVRGTDHEVALVLPQDAAPGMEAGVHNRVNEGATVLKNANGAVTIARGTAAYAPEGGRAPMLHPAVPAFFNRLRSVHDTTVQAQASSVRQRMEERLRARGKLGPDERFEGLRQRQAPLRQRRADAGQPGNAQGLPEQRQQRLQAREERLARRRQQNNLAPRERKPRE